MKKIFCLFFILSSFLLFATDFHMNGNKVSLDTVEYDGKNYIFYDSLENLGLDILSSDNKITLSKENLIMEFFIGKKNVTVNGVQFSLIHAPKDLYGKTYLDFDFIKDVLGYKIAGNELKYDAPSKNYFGSVPKKIISLSPAVTEKLFAIGAGKEIVGRTIYCTYPLEAKKIDSVGTMYEPKLELILEKRPDLVIAETHFNSKTLEILRKFGVKCIVENSPKNLDEIYTSILHLGEQVGKIYEAKALVFSMKEKVSMIEQLSKKYETKPRVYYVLASGKSEFTAGAGTFISHMIKIAGGKNIADDVQGWAYSPEKLVANNPEIIFGEKKYVDTMVKKYKTLDAVKNGKYYYVDEDIFVLPGPRALNEGIETMFEIFHKKYEIGKR